jgi:hypothetical protein
MEHVFLPFSAIAHYCIPDPLPDDFCMTSWKSVFDAFARELKWFV